MRTRARSRARIVPSRSRGRGGRSRASVSAASSRAMPSTERQSGRFGVISISSTWSSSPRCFARSPPTGASRSSSSRPASCSSPRPSSRSEQRIPCDSTPWIFLAAMTPSPGSVAPGGAKAARTPARVFGAPHTTLKRSPLPARTRHSTRWWPRLSPRSRSIASISPITAPRRPTGASGVTLATSIPALTRRSAASCGESFRSTNSRTQPYGILTRTVSRTAGRSRRRGGCRRRRT